MYTRCLRRLFVESKNRVFYNPVNSGEITFLGEIWLYKATIMWILSCLLIGLPMICYWFADWTGCDRNDLTNWKMLIYGCPLIFGFFILYCLGCTFSIFLCEIIFFSPFAFYLFLAAHERFVGSDAGRSILCKKAFDFVVDNKSLFTKINDNDNDNDDDVNQLKLNIFEKRLLLSHKERLFRVIYANYCFMRSFEYTRCETKLVEYLDKEIENDWNNVTYLVCIYWFICCMLYVVCYILSWIH